MSEEFRVGDVVSCIDREGSAAFGTVARVMGVRFGHAMWDGEPIIGLRLNIRFWRKLPRADDEFIQQIRACQPHRSTVSA